MTLIAPIMSPPPVHVRPPRRLAVASDLGRLGGSLARSRSGRNLKLTAVAVNGYARFGRALAVNCSLSLMRRVCDPHERGRTRQRTEATISAPARRSPPEYQVRRMTRVSCALVALAVILGAWLSLAAPASAAPEGRITIARTESTEVRWVHRAEMS